MLEEKKVYPSQINTKAIACRVPTTDYVKFLQDAISKNITLNDWLLMRIYPQSTISENKENFGVENKFVSVGINHLSFLQDRYYNLIDKFNFRIDENGNHRCFYTFESKQWREYLGEEMECKNFIDLHKLISIDAVALDKETFKKEISVEDIRSQLIILANQTFENSKDVREFMKDINEVLSDLED